MIDKLLGSKNKERILLFLVIRGSGYAHEIAKFYETDISPIQRQLEILEDSGFLVSSYIGRTRVFKLNQRNAFKSEIEALITKVFDFLPQQEQDDLKLIRRRPRRKGKPIEKD